FILIASMTEHSKGQYVNIPDATFRTWLMNNGYAGCMSGNDLDTTCPAVVSAFSVNCSSLPIADLTGIQYFDSLVTLDCFGNQLTSLPPLPGMLIYLFCSTNQLANLPA